MATSTLQPIALSLEQAASLLSISPRTLRKWAAERRLTSCKVGGRLLFRPEDLQTFLESAARQAVGPVRIK
jgi:excisionase family DNA binding protein